MANINIRIDDALKQQADAVLAELGMNMTTATTVFLKQHSIIDVLAALILEIPLYILIFKVDWKGLFLRKARKLPVEYSAEPAAPKAEAVRETVTMD